MKEGPPDNTKAVGMCPHGNVPPCEICIREQQLEQRKLAEHAGQIAEKYLALISEVDPNLDEKQRAVLQECLAATKERVPGDMFRRDTMVTNDTMRKALMYVASWQTSVAEESDRIRRLAENPSEAVPSKMKFLIESNLPASAKEAILAIALKEGEFSVSELLQKMANMENKRDILKVADEKYLELAKVHPDLEFSVGGKVIRQDVNELANKLQCKDGDRVRNLAIQKLIKILYPDVSELEESE